jgi:hypothetical protein
VPNEFRNHLDAHCPTLLPSKDLLERATIVRNPSQTHAWTELHICALFRRSTSDGGGRDVGGSEEGGSDEGVRDKPGERVSAARAVLHSCINLTNHPNGEMQPHGRRIWTLQHPHLGEEFGTHGSAPGAGTRDVPSRTNGEAAGKLRGGAGVMRVAESCSARSASGTEHLACRQRRGDRQAARRNGGGWHERSCGQADFYLAAHLAARR